MPPTEHKFDLEIIKSGVSLNKIPLNSKSHWIFGRDQQSVDIVISHPSCSRIHAVLQHRKDGQWFLFDFGSTHFTKLNRKKLFPHKYYKIDIGSIIQFGTSQRMYIFNGPSELQSFPESEDEERINGSLSRSKVMVKSKGQNPQNIMKSMIKQLAEKSKEEKASNLSYRKTVRTPTIWGMDDDDDYLVFITFDEDEAKSNRHAQELQTNYNQKKRNNIKRCRIS